MFASLRQRIAASSAVLALGVGIAALQGPVGAPQIVSPPRAPHQPYGATTGADSLGAMVGSDYGYASRSQFRPIFDPSPSTSGFPPSMLAAAP